MNTKLPVRMILHGSFDLTYLGKLPHIVITVPGLTNMTQVSRRVHYCDPCVRKKADSGLTFLSIEK